MHGSSAEAGRTVDLLKTFKTWKFSTTEMVLKSNLRRNTKTQRRQATQKDRFLKVIYTAFLGGLVPLCLCVSNRLFQGRFPRPASIFFSLSNSLLNWRMRWSRVFVSAVSWSSSEWRERIKVAAGLRRLVG